MVFSGQAGGTPARLSAIWGPPEVLGMEVVPIDFEVASDLAFWRAEVPGKVSARAEALTGPMTLPGQRVQLLNAPGSESALDKWLPGARPRRIGWTLWG
jgi:hypothetical protein